MPRRKVARANIFGARKAEIKLATHFYRARFPLSAYILNRPYLLRLPPAVLPPHLPFSPFRSLFIPPWNARARARECGKPRASACDSFINRAILRRGREGKREEDLLPSYFYFFRPSAILENPAGPHLVRRIPRDSFAE